MSKSRQCILGLFAVIVLWAAAFKLRADDQAQFGEQYSRNMISPEKSLPTAFDLKTGKNIKWKAALGSNTYATPVVAGGRVLIGTNNDNPRDPRHKGDRGILLCLDEKDGSLCWQLVVPKCEGDIYQDWPKIGICSPPTVEGDRVYVVTNRTEVLCLNLKVTTKDADIIWAFDIPAKTGTYRHDTGYASILLHGDYLYLNSCNGVDNTHRRIRAPEAPSLIVLEKSTGRLVAQDDEHIGPDIFHSTWSSPALGTVNGRPLIFFAGGNGVCYAFETVKSALAPTKGERGRGEGAVPEGKVEKLKKVWQFDCEPTAPKTNIHKYIGNRKEGPSNVNGMPVFYNNRVFVAAGGDFQQGKTKSFLKCIDATKTGDITATGELWSYPMNNATCATPAIAHGLVFVTDCGGTLHCVDIDTGKPYWTHTMKGQGYGSPLVADGKVYAGTLAGELWTLAAAKEKKVLGSVSLDRGIAATPMAANGVLYLTTMNQLLAVRQLGTD